MQRSAVRSTPPWSGCLRWMLARLASGGFCSESSYWCAPSRGLPRRHLPSPILSALCRRMRWRGCGTSTAGSQTQGATPAHAQAQQPKGTLPQHLPSSGFSGEARRPEPMVAEHGLRDDVLPVCQRLTFASAFAPLCFVELVLRGHSVGFGRFSLNARSVFLYFLVAAAASFTVGWYCPTP